jgi:hypothetical protein
MPPLPVHILKILFFFVLHLHQSRIAFGLRVPNAMDLDPVPWELLRHVLSDSSKLWAAYVAAPNRAGSESQALAPYRAEQGGLNLSTLQV